MNKRTKKKHQLSYWTIERTIKKKCGIKYLHTRRRFNKAKAKRNKMILRQTLLLFTLKWEELKRK